MSNCLSCGADNPIDMHFCQQCGARLQEEEIENSKRAKQSNESKTPKPPMKTATKIVIAFVTIIILGASIAHFTIKNKLDPYKQLTNINKAFVNEDYTTFLNYFAIDDGVIVDEKAFYQYMQKNNWIEKISPQIEEGFKKIDKGSFASAIVDNKGYKIATILDEKKFLGMYNQYTVKIIPVEVNAHTSITKAKLTYNDNSKEITKKPVALGKFIPGIYNFKIDVSDDFTTTKLEKKQEIVNSENNQQELFFDFTADTLKINSDYKDSIIFINDKSTKKKASELNLFTIPLDGSVTMHAEYTNGDKKSTSETIKVTSNEVYLPFAEVQEKLAVNAAKEELLSNYREYARSFYYEFRNNYQDAVNYGDFSYVSNYFQDGTKLKKDYSAFVLDHRDFDYYYNYNFLSNDITDIVAVDNNTLTLKSSELFEFYTSEDGDWKYEREKLYTLKVIDQTLYIANIEDVGKVKKTKIN